MGASAGCPQKVVRQRNSCAVIWGRVPRRLSVFLWLVVGIRREHLSVLGIRHREKAGVSTRPMFRRSSVAQIKSAAIEHRCRMITVRRQRGAVSAQLMELTRSRCGHEDSLRRRRTAFRVSSNPGRTCSLKAIGVALRRNTNAGARGTGLRGRLVPPTA